MDDEPRFPSPDEAKAQAETVVRSASSPAPAQAPTKRVVASRPEPAADDAPKAPGGLSLSREEVHALLAVAGANQAKEPPTKLGKLWRRGRIVLLPTGLLGTGLHLAFGDQALWAIGVLVVLSFAWIARPLLRRDGWS